MMPRKAPPMLVFGAIFLALAGCGEIDQQAKSEKLYAGKKDSKAFESPAFGNDRAKWEATLAQRSKTQNEYLRTETK
jgi:hypothetical protein